MFLKARISGVNVDSRDYHALKSKVPRGDKSFAMSPSALKAFSRLPSRWIRGWTPPETKAQAWGQLVDCRTLTPELFFGRYAIQPEGYPDTGMKCPKCESITDSKTCSKCKEERLPVVIVKPWRYGAKHTDAWKSEQQKAGKEIVDTENLTGCDAAIKRLFEPIDGDDTIKRFFDASERQVLLTGEWHDEETGLTIPVSALLDLVPRGDTEFATCVADYKSGISAHPFKFQKQAFDFGYHVQAAFDLDLLNAATGQKRDTWCFIIQESFDPWEPNRAIYGQEAGMGQPGFIELGRETRHGGYEAMLANYCKCLKANKWPHYNENADTAQGWCVLRPTPWQTGETAFAQTFDFEEPEEDAPEFPHLERTATQLVNIDEVIP